MWTNLQYWLLKRIAPGDPGSGDTTCESHTKQVLAAELRCRLRNPE
jgi:hypothetical protein